MANDHIHTSKGSNDECYTPEYAIVILLEYLERFRGKIIWCPFDTEESNFVKILRSNGFEVVCSHVGTGQNFFTYEPEHWDLIVSNPPFTDKKSTFERCLQLGKPFALLMTFLWLNDKSPVDIFLNFQKDLQLLIFDERIEYLNQPQNKRINFKSVYYCVDFLPSNLILKRLFENKDQQKLSLVF